MSDWAPFIPRTTRTTRSWSREEVRELNNALQLALEYFNIPKDANKSAAKAIEKRARGWSVRWYRLRNSPVPGNMVNQHAGKKVPFIPGKILQRSVRYNSNYDLEQLNFDIWDLSEAPDARVTRRVAGLDPQGNPAIPLNTAEEVDFDSNIRLTPVLTASQNTEITNSRKVVVVDRKFQEAPSHVTIADLVSQGIFRRLPEFIIQLGCY